MNTGARVWNCELSSIDTTLLLCGVLTCRQYFQDPQIQSLAAQIYNRVNWPWMLNGGSTFSMGWTPESGFLSSRWDHYCELLMLYLLAIGSETKAVPPSTWDAFRRPKLTYAGLTYITDRVAPLFIHQYSHAWFDFRNKHDKYANCFESSVTATRAHRLFCVSLHSHFRDYQPNLWGITSSDSANGYTAWGGPPPIGDIDWSIVPCAAAGSLPFAPADCVAVLRTIYSQYPQAWQRYGFVDGSAYELVRPGCDRDRCRNHYAYGGEPAERVRLEDIHEKSRSAERVRGSLAQMKCPSAHSVFDRYFPASRLPRSTVTDAGGRS